MTMAESFRAAVAPALSVVVPAPADVAALEETLVSVLENRPPAAEVVVALGCEYADPWNIREEVRFVQAPPGASLAACTNLGIAAAAGRVVNVLAAGWQATEGWTNAPLEHFSRGGVAAVVPLVVAGGDRDRVVAAGLRTTRGGRRIVVGGATNHDSRRFPRPAAPLLEAGFWSADLLAACGGFAPACGDWLADADMAAVLACGGDVVLEPASRVIGGPMRTRPPAFTAGLLSERLFWRSLAGQRLLPALLAHGVEVLRDAAAAAPFGTLPRLVGRLVGLLEFGGHVERGRRLAALKAEREAEQPADSPTLRIDEAHRRLSRPRRRTSPLPLKRSA
jgi:hypothetical protein